MAKRRASIRKRAKNLIWEASKTKPKTAPCYYCGKNLPREQTTLDHFQPHSLGGSNRIQNLVISCRICNKQKKTVPGEDFLSWKIQALVRSGGYKVPLRNWLAQNKG